MNFNKLKLGVLITMMGSSTAFSAAEPAFKIQPVTPVIQARPEHVVLTKDNTISINDVFYGQTVAQLVAQARDLDARTESSDPIYLVINSPGGSIDDGLELIENLSNMRRPVKTVSLFSASMGFQTVQGLGERLVIANGTLMSHKARGSFGGEFPGQLDARYSYYLKRVMRLDAQAARRTNGKFTLDTYHSLIENEYWCDGQDCIDNGFADRLVNPSCDKSLTGTKEVPVEQFTWGGHTVEIMATYDNCPLNTQALKYTILVDGEPLFKGAGTTITDKGTETVFTYSGGKSFSSDELSEINRRVKEVITRKVKREVVKGY